MKIGYVRVSTEHQKTIRQEVIMEQLQVDRIFIDKTSGKDLKRPEFQKMMDFIREGDTLVIESYSRAVRSTRELLELVEKLKEKGVEFVSLKEKINTTTPQGKLMLTLFAGVYEFEREVMLERQREGIAIAKAEGKYKGRKPKTIDIDKFEKLYKEWKAAKISAVAFQKQINLKPSTFYRKVKEFETQTGVK